MRVRLWAALLVMMACAVAQTGTPVAEVVSLVRSAIEDGQPDAQIAKSLHRIKLAESLDAGAIRQLQSEGAGARALAELERLRRSSSALPAAPAAAYQPPPAPSPEEQKRILEAARESALSYTRSLPDFICTEVVRRFEEPRSRLLDTLTLKLSYFEQKEKYQLLTVNGRPTLLSYESVGGVITEGEFGSLLSEVFSPGSEAEFRWARWTALRQRPAQVYAFRVSAAHSHYRILRGGPGGTDEAVAGQHGFVYLDHDTSRTVRVVAEADSLPRDFPVRSVRTILDYDFVEIGGRQFLLPLRAGARMTTVQTQTRNEVVFHSYKKFAADATITYTGKQ